MTKLLDEKTIEAIEKAVNRGETVEIRKERTQIVIVAVKPQRMVLKTHAI